MSKKKERETVKEQTPKLTAADDSNRGMFVIGEKDITQSKRKTVLKEKCASTIQRLSTKLHNNKL